MKRITSNTGSIFDTVRYCCNNTVAMKGESMSKAYKTAIKRKKLSAPMAKLQQLKTFWSPDWTGYLAVDFGCGRGDDVDHLKKMDYHNAHWIKYDPYYFPKNHSPLMDSVDIVTCNYVLNVIPSDADKLLVLQQIQDLLNENGRAYITVRRDIKKEGLTKTGTWQETVKLRLHERLYFQGKYVTYYFDKDTDISDVIVESGSDCWELYG